MEKNRYMVTLDQEAAFKVKKHLKALGLPHTQFSVLLNEYLVMIEPTLEMLAEKKRTGSQVTIFEILEETSKAAKKF